MENSIETANNLIKSLNIDLRDKDRYAPEYYELAKKSKDIISKLVEELSNAHAVIRMDLLEKNGM